MKVMEGKERKQVTKHIVKEPLRHLLTEDKFEQIFFSLSFCSSLCKKELLVLKE